MQLITVEELKSRMDAGETIRLLDVREPAEHQDFNIGGILLPVGNVMRMETDEIDGWKDEEIICYCRSGNRSGQACLVLETAGFSNTKNLQGGMLAWIDKFGR
jgi:rhodanese-related sulfurtransferase